LFHLIGAKDSFLQEVNVAYRLGLEEHLVCERTLRKALRAKGVCSPALAEITRLEKPKPSNWLAVAIALRNQGTHRHRAKRHFVRVIGQPSASRNYLMNPLAEGELVDPEIPEFMRQCLDNMRRLLEELRTMLPDADKEV